MKQSINQAINQTIMVEPLLLSSNDRLVLFPIQHQDLWELYKQHTSTFWTREEIDFSTDMVDWTTKMDDQERHFIKHVLAFFAASDGLVSENLVSRFCNEVQYPEARAFYGFQNMMENIHNETYSAMIDTYIQDNDERHRLFHAMDEVPAVKKKAQWVQQWIEDEQSTFAERLVAFAAVEGIFFSGSFCAIFWLNERNLMKGLSLANQFIARDEGLHQTFACVLYKNHIRNKLDASRLTKIITDAVAIEKEFILEALSCKLLGMDARQMSQYIEYVADRLLAQLGHVPFYHSKNPFDFMNMISLSNKTNFFESRVSEYQRVPIRDSDFSMTADF